MKAKPPWVYTVLLNWNSAEYTIPCVESLMRQTYKNNCILVVDNGSEDGSLDKIRRECGNDVHTLALDRNYGFTGGNNRGIQFALDRGSDYVLILNNDTCADPALIAELVAVAETDTDIGIVTAKIFFYDQHDVLWYAGGYFRRGFLRSVHRGRMEKDSGQYDEICDSPFVTGCCMLIRRKIFEEVGTFDPRFYIYSEDADLSIRTARHGYRLVYTSGARLWHKESSSVRKNTLLGSPGSISPFQHYFTTRNHLYLVRKHARGMEKALSIGCLLGKAVLWSGLTAARGRSTKTLAIYRGLRDGLFTSLNAEAPVTRSGYA
ncbi:MAG: glycosyltransferase family 2 protein [Kiritimatiellae bacterium]|nr:glycosyltransferase family 2 protein [Kiritimatiellia bacterium]